MELTGSQIVKLIENNLDGKFRYHLDNIVDEKRPFGNSGFPQIQKDMMEIIGVKKSWNVSDEDELDELKWAWMQECFGEIKDWINNNSDDYEIKLVKKNDTKYGGDAE